VSVTDDGGTRSPTRRRSHATGRATISTVAEAAGVSTATVSRVLSGNRSVTPELVDRVHKAVADLSYQPSCAARSLALGSVRNLGVVLPDLGNAYFFDVVKHLHRAALAQGYRTLIADHSGDPHDELETVIDLLAQVDGVVVMSSRIDIAQLKQLAHQPTPLVLVNRVELGVEVPMVAVDTFTAMMRLCGHLASLGHRRLVYLAGSGLSWQNRERWRAVETASSVFGFEAVQVPGDSTIDGGHQATLQALEHAPTALVCFNDLTALGAISQLRNLGLHVPKDISVTGFDDIAMARHLQPRLTTVVSPTQQLGEQAWTAMADALQGDDGVDSVLIPAEPVIRDSTGPAATH
jgi:LacI family transcriptional regulator, repressor for deo operon, udp, cdd, tsx, nupC, and nupG